MDGRRAARALPGWVADLAGPGMPGGLRWLRNREDGRVWLGALAGILAACADAWGLRLGQPFDGGLVSLVVAATLHDGAPAILKVQFPDRDSEHEAAALARWDGAGAVRLLAHDAVRHALLLERCEPGTPLSGEPESALVVLAGMLPRLWVPAGPPFRPLADEAARWAGDLDAAWERARRPFERRLVDAALEALHAVPGSQGEQVLVHQDLHGGNVLRARREPWLAIDPKPLAGEREFAVAPIVRSFELGDSRRHVLRRLDRLTGDLGLDRTRARSWTIAQTVAWSCAPGRSDRHVQAARWLLESSESKRPPG